MNKGNILISTVGRPTSKRIVKSRVETINRYNINQVIGLIPKGNRKEDEIYMSIIKGWKDEINNIEKNSTIIVEELKLDLKPFSEKIDKINILHDFKNEQILLVAEKIINLIDENTNGIIFDVASGRRIMSPICITVAYFLLDLGFNKDIEGNKAKYLKNIVHNIKIITRPTGTLRPIQDEKKDEHGKTVQTNYAKKDRTLASYNEIDLFRFPSLTTKEAKILKLWSTHTTHTSLAYYYEERYNAKKNTIEVNCKNLQKKLEIYKFVNTGFKKKHPPLTSSGKVFQSIYDQLIE